MGNILTGSLEAELAACPDDGLSAFLERLFWDRGWDFRNYKKSSLERRIAIRLNAHNSSSYREYYDTLKSNPAEYDRLLSALTIKVTEFFREPEVFDLLKEVIPPKASGPDELRAWCCGCAYGNEAYSLAILIAESLGLRKLRSTKICATDISGDAIDFGRKATYREGMMQNISDTIREKYFFQTPEGYKVKYNIRNSIRFGLLNIVKDPPISKIDIIFCRNLLIYFDKDLQKRVFEKLDYALNPGGVLVLGKAEALPASLAPRYAEFERKARVYIKRGSQ